jgi:hypothetical protein
LKLLEVARAAGKWQPVMNSLKGRIFRLCGVIHPDFKQFFSLMAVV